MVRKITLYCWLTLVAGWLTTSPPSVAVPARAALAPWGTVAVPLSDTLARPLATDTVRTVPASGWARLRARAAATYDRARTAFRRIPPPRKVNPVSEELMGVVFYCMAGFVGCIFAMLFFVALTRLRRNHRAHQYTALRDAYENQLVAYIYGDEEADPASQFDANALRQPRHRAVLIEQLISLHKNLSGGAAARLRALYLALDLPADALRRLRVRDWSVKAKAVRELAQLEIAEALEPITAYLNSTNPVLALEAQTALLKLNPAQPFAFLSHVQTSLSDWQQLNLLTLISHSPTFIIPDFGQWLASSNATVAQFAARMVAHFNQHAATPQLVDTLDHPEEVVRAAVIKCLGELAVTEADEALMARFPKESEAVQVLVLAALGKIGTYKATEFLKLAARSDHFTLAFGAAKALRDAGQPLAHTPAETPDLHNIVKHLLDERI